MTFSGQPFVPQTDKPWREPNAPDCRCGHPASVHGPVSGGCYGSNVRAFYCSCGEYELPMTTTTTTTESSTYPTEKVPTP